MACLRCHASPSCKCLFARWHRVNSKNGKNRRVAYFEVSGVLKAPQEPLNLLVVDILIVFLGPSHNVGAALPRESPIMVGPTEKEWEVRLFVCEDQIQDLF